MPLDTNKVAFSPNMPAIYEDKLIGGTQLSSSMHAGADISNAQSSGLYFMVKMQFTM
jgi:hypothetical protein